uniref:PAS domain-containing protein n=1 Tax=Panagrolaimus davidi TaxID=227884 RepID=A0A914QL14_9BILA
MLTPQGLPSYDINEANFSQLALKSVGGFVIALSEWGDIYYVSENIDQYLGFCQSDVLHQSITDLLHSEDRESILKALKVQKPKMKGSSIETKMEYDTMERIVMGRFRCLLDNTCGFVRMEIRGKFLRLNALASPSEDVVPSKDKSKYMSIPYAFAAICTKVDGISLLEKRGTVKGSIFTHDEPSLQSPRTLSTAQNLTLI